MWIPKKDYVSIQMIKIWICYTMAYLLLTLIGVICMGNGTQAVSFSRQVLIRIGCIWVVGYLGFLTAVLAMAHQCYSRRYRTAAILVRQYRQHLMALEDTIRKGARSMTALLELRQKISEVYGRYEAYVRICTKCLLAFLVFI